MFELDWFRILETSIGAFTGAGLGAFVAFNLEAWRQKRNEHRRQIAALNHALFILSIMLEKLQNIKLQFIDPCSQNDCSYVTMQPSIDSHIAFSFDIDKLTFLLSKQPDLLRELLLQQYRYDGFFNAWIYRSKLHINQVQPKLESAGFVHGGNYTDLKIQTALGNALTATMKNLTEEIVEQNSKTMDSISNFSEKFARDLKSLFPKEHFLRFELIEQTKKEVTKPHPENLGKS